MTSADERGLYHFLGNISSHVIHALPIHRAIGGTFVVLSRDAGEVVESYGLPVIVIDDEPQEFIKLSRAVKTTLSYLNEHASVILCYEVFRFPRTVPFSRPKKVFLSHGAAGLKNYVGMSRRRRRSLQSYDYMSAMGPFAKARFIDQNRIDPAKLVDLGTARTDDTIRNRGRVVVADALVRHAGIDPARTIVSYMPTYWGVSSVHELGVRLVEHIPDDIQVLFRPHPQTPSEVLEPYMKLVDERRNIVYAPEGKYPGVGLLEIYDASAVVISDVSSVMLEAILLDKPLIFARDLARADEQDLSAIHELVSASGSVDLDSASNIAEIVASTIERGIDISIWEMTKDRMFFHHDGTSVSSIADFVETLLPPSAAGADQVASLNGKRIETT